ncbi:hypothetical protein GRJ2_003115900 [Grus japonensis]|uniref:Endonuclease/exonuclease/phosphatase domain-containing protein n=1 Tax=Grus japonensis TaxID=30415 RepID=A0ABC9Y937_GRUJA
MGDTVVGVYYRPPDQEEEVDEAFYRQLEVASRSQALVLMGDFNCPDICWKGNRARHAQSRRFLQSTDDNFLTQVVEEPTRRGVLLDLVLMNKEGLVGDVKDGGSLGCSDHEMVEFRILHGRSRAPMEVNSGADIHLQPMEDPTLEQVDAPEGGCDPVGSPHWSKLLAGPVTPWREEPTLEQVFWQDL